VQAARYARRVEVAASAGVHPSSVNRLLQDEVDEPLPDHLMGLAQALDLRASDLFLLAGLPIPGELPSVDAMLRAEYGLSEQGLAEAKRVVAAIAASERKKASSRESRHGNTQPGSEDQE